MGIFGLIDELPDFGGVQARLLGDGLMESFAVEQHDHRVAGGVGELVERDGSGGDGGGLREGWDLAKLCRDGSQAWCGCG